MVLALPLSFASSPEEPGVSARTLPREDVSPAAGRMVPISATKLGGQQYELHTRRAKY